MPVKIYLRWNRFTKNTSQRYYSDVHSKWRNLILNELFNYCLLPRCVQHYYGATYKQGSVNYNNVSTLYSEGSSILICTAPDTETVAETKTDNDTDKHRTQWESVLMSVAV